MANVEGMREVLAELGRYPGGRDLHGMMDQSVVDRCRELSAKPDLDATDVHLLLDDCAYASLCTDFVMRVLDVVWRELETS